MASESSRRRLLFSAFSLFFRRFRPSFISSPNPVRRASVSIFAWFECAEKKRKGNKEYGEPRKAIQKKGPSIVGKKVFFLSFFFFLSLSKLSFFLLLPSSLRTSQAERDQSERHSLFRNKTVSPWSPRSAPSSSTRGSRRTRLMPPGRARGPREGEMRRR